MYKKLLHSLPPLNTIAAHMWGHQIQSRTFFKTLNHVDGIPNELLFEILSHLGFNDGSVNAFGATCRRFAEAAHGPKIRFQENRIHKLLETKVLEVLIFNPSDGRVERFDKVLDYLHWLREPGRASVGTGSPDIIIRVLYHLGPEDKHHLDLPYLLYLVRSLRRKHQLSLELHPMPRKAWCFALDNLTEKLLPKLVEFPWSDLVMNRDATIIKWDSDCKVAAAVQSQHESSLSPELQSNGTPILAPVIPAATRVYIQSSDSIFLKRSRPLGVSVLNSASPTSLVLIECIWSTTEWSAILPSLSLPRLDTCSIISYSAPPVDPDDLSKFLARHPLIHTLILVGANHLMGEWDIDADVQPVPTPKDWIQPLGPVLLHLVRIKGAPLYLCFFLDRIQHYPTVKEISLYTGYSPCGCISPPLNYSRVFDKLSIVPATRSLTLYLTSLDESGIFSWLLKRSGPNDGTRMLCIKTLNVVYHGFALRPDLVSALKPIKASRPFPTIEPQGILETQAQNASVLLPYLVDIFPSLELLRFEHPEVPNPAVRCQYWDVLDSKVYAWWTVNNMS